MKCECTKCKGKGFLHGGTNSYGDVIYLQCPKCKGKGRIESAKKTEQAIKGETVMGMEVTLKAYIEVSMPNGIKKMMIESFPCWHIATETTKKIMCSLKEEQVQVYKDWLYSLPPEEGDNNPEDYNSLSNRRSGHIRYLEQWLEDHKNWNIEWGAKLLLKTIDL